MLLSLAADSVRYSLFLLLAFVVHTTSGQLQADQPKQKSKSEVNNTGSKVKSKRRRKRSKTKNSGPLFRISKETTFFTEPLLKSGRVDYLTALNNYAKPEGLSPEKNGAVYLIKAIGRQEDVPDFHTINQWKAIGLREDGKGFYAFPIKDGPVLIDSAKYVQLRTGSFSAKEKKKFRDYFFTTLTNLDLGPWKSEQYPELKKWIDLNERSLHLVTKSTEQPLFYLPYVWGTENETPAGILIGVMHPAVMKQRSFARLLAMRALNHLGENRPKEAAKDFMTIHKLARQAGRHGTLIENLVAVALDSMAFIAEKYLIQSPDLSLVELKQLEKEIQALPPVTNIVQALNIHERCVTLDAIQYLAQSSSNEVGIDVMDLELPEGLQQVLRSLSFDWNQALIEFNRYYDQLHEINQQPYFVQRKMLVEKEDELSKIRSEISTSTLVLQGVLLGRKARTRMLTTLLKILILSPYSSAIDTEQRSLTKKDLALTHISLELYKRANGEYPDSLADLVPKYLAKVPAERFVENQNLKYASDGKSFKLYSVGPDGKDDQDGPAGTGYDIVISVP